MESNNVKIALTEQEVQELANGESIYLTIGEGIEAKTLEIYQGEEEENNK